MQGLFSSIAKTFMPETNNYHNRLQEIEEEILARRKEEELLSSNPQQDEKRNRYKFGKGD